MLTTHQSEGDYLSSRCMALAAQVWSKPRSNDQCSSPKPKLQDQY
jgi:hypothetical protein